MIEHSGGVKQMLKASGKFNQTSGGIGMQRNLSTEVSLIKSANADEQVLEMYRQQ